MEPMCEGIAGAFDDPVIRILTNSRDPLAGGLSQAHRKPSDPCWRSGRVHNLFLELWSELGLVAKIAVAAAILFFHLLAVQVSGSINDNRDFRGMLAIAWLVVAGGITAHEPVEP